MGLLMGHLQEYLKNCIIFIWKNLMSIPHILTDNVFLILIIYASVGTIISAVIRRLVFKKNIAGGLFSSMYCLMAAEVIKQLPNIHTRLNLALNTTYSILSQSEYYMEVFQSVSQVKRKSAASVLQYLYHLPIKERTSWCEVYPGELYKHLYSTIHKINHVFVFGEITDRISDAGVVSICIHLILWIIICGSYIILRKAKKIALANVILVSLSVFRYKWILLIAFWIWISEGVIYCIFYNDKQRKESVTLNS